MTRKQRIATIAETQKQRLRDAFDAGSDYFSSNPDALMAEVHRYASAIYSGKAEALEFAEGYSTARRWRDEFLSEKNEPVPE
jgi:hypothetical protein